jgi:hypothetical protein
MNTYWDRKENELVFTPDDPRLLTGIFALGTALADQESLARDLITSYYWDILGRAPEPGAEQGWYAGYFQYSVSLGIDVRFVFREMARIFFTSSEYQARGRTDEQFLRDNYWVFLRREASQAEISGWLGGEWNRTQAVSMFSQSAEFASYIKGLFTCHDGVSTRNFVTTMYIGLLDRLVDGDGLLYFESVLDMAFADGGITAVRDAARELGADILNSAEYLSTNPSNETHVVRLYRAYLGRFPSSSELNYWRNRLDLNLATPAVLINIFSDSPEFTSRLLTFFGPN